MARFLCSRSPCRCCLHRIASRLLFPAGMIKYLGTEEVRSKFFFLSVHFASLLYFRVYCCQVERRMKTAPPLFSAWWFLAFLLLVYKMCSICSQQAVVPLVWYWLGSMIEIHIYIHTELTDYVSRHSYWFASCVGYCAVARTTGCVVVDYRSRQFVSMPTGTTVSQKIHTHYKVFDEYATPLIIRIRDQWHANNAWNKYIGWQ